MEHWPQVVTIIGANLAAFMWARKEASDDRRQFTALMNRIQDEMMDFQKRMSSMEERRNKKKG